MTQLIHKIFFAQQTQPPPPPIPSKVATPNRQRRSTGSNRSSKESEDETASATTAASSVATPAATTASQTNKQETEEKIKAILEQAKQQQEQTALGLLKEVQQQQPPSQQPLLQPQQSLSSSQPIVSVHHNLPSQQQATAAAAAMIQVQQRPTVLTTRMPVTSTVSTLTFPTQASLRPQLPQVVQLPTQPIPPSEIARTSKQVLLEPKANKLVSPSKLVAIPTTSPRATSITLPTQPVPMSQTQLNSVTSSIVAKTMGMSMLPNQPLPQPMAMGQQPKLPQHPVPPMPPTSATSITLVPAPRSASPVKPQHVALKKREYMNSNEHKVEVEQQKPLEVYPNPRKDHHMKPRDRFGAHLIKEEPKQQPLKMLQPPPPSSPSLPSLEQLIMMREQEMSMVYQSLIKQGNNEQMANYVATQMATERYKSAIDAVLQINNERPKSVDNYQRGPQGDPNPPPGPFNVPMAHAHARQPNPYVHDPYNRALTTNAGIASQLQQQQQQQQQQPPPQGPASPEPTEFTYPSLEAYPVVWQGHLGLKNESASVQFHYISGCKELARNSLPLEPIPHMATLRIGQRMRLEDAHLSGVRTKMQQTGEHCVLLALPCGKDPSDVEAQSRQLREHFITYLQLKGAAGIVNVAGDYNEGGYVVHVFPSCDFANETMTSIAPDLLARVAEIEHMVIVIATVLDKAASTT